jgi:peptidoglycan L-alanyl-D-glutamate endopeptidase CwlK
MSRHLFGYDVIFHQRLLKAQGLYGGTVDGRWGPLTEAADAEFERRGATLRDLGVFDARSERLIAGLHLKAQMAARRLLALAVGAGFLARVISGTRSYAEQDQLHAQGRYGNAGLRVTNARGGQSNHNFGIAWDVGLFDADGSYLNGDTTDEIDAYRRLGALARPLALEWGGDWSSLPDVPHYQLPTGRTVAATRRLFEAGQPYA